MPHTDIKSEGWIAKMPEVVRPYLLLMRLDRPIGVWLLLLPGWWGMMVATRGVQGMFGYDWFVFVLFVLGAVIMRAAGCIINDIWDRKLDAQVARTAQRPLASGAIKLWQAAALLFCLLSTGFIILIMMPTMTTIQIGFVAVVMIAIYPYMKRITWWPQLFLGLTFNLGALMGYAAIADTLPPSAWVLYLSCILWTIGYDTIYAHQDKEDDMLVGIKSTALLFGARSKMIVSGLYIASFMLLITAVSMEGASPLVIALMVLAWLQLVWQLFRWEPDNAENSLMIFKSNRDYAIVVFVVLALNSFY